MKMSKEIKEQQEQRDEINQLLNRKDYILTVYQTGDKAMSGGDFKRQVTTRRYYQSCSLEEIPSIIGSMKRSWWTHKDLKKDLSNADDIPFEEKKWGINTNVVIEPLSEELEKDYVGSSKLGFFKTHRHILKHEEESKK